SAMLPTISAGQVWVGNATNGAQAFTLSDDVASVSNTGVVTLSSSATGSNKLPLAGGTMSGAINMGGNNISNAGDVSLAAGKFLGLGVGSTAGTVTGQMWYDSGVIKYFDGTTTQSLGVAGAGITSLNGLTSGTQSFVNGTSGTAPAFSSAGSAHTLNIPMASSASVTAGLISNADYASMMAKQSNSLAAGQVWVGNASGAAQAFSLSGDVASVSDTGLVTVNKTILGLSNKLLQLDNTGIANTYGVSIYGATSGQIYLSAMPTTTVYGLRFPATAPADNQILKANSSGDLSWVTYLANVSDSAPLTNGKMWIGNASGIASEVTMSGDATITNAGLLSLKNTGTAGTYTKVITDAQGRVTSGSALAASDITTALTYTPVNKAGDTMSGSLMLVAGQYLGLGSGSTAGTVAGQVWYDSGTIKYFDGTTAKSLGVAGAGITSINGATVSSQTFPVPGTSGTAPAWSINTGAGSHTLNIPMASAASVTAGLISNTDYAAFNAKMSNSLTGGQIWVGNSANVAQAMSLGGDVASVSNAGVVTLKSVGTVGTYWKVVTDAQGRVTSGGALASGDVTTALGYTPASTGSSYVNGGNSFAGNATIGLNDAYTLGFKTGGTTRMTLDASGNLGIGTSAPGAVLDVRGPSGGVGGDTFRVSNPSGQTYLYAFSTADTSASLGAWSSSGSQKPLLINEGGTANVGIGNVASPGSLLSVAGNVAVGTYASSAAPTNGLIVSGNVGIGTASPGVALDVSSKTDAIGLPVGNTSQRPSNATGLLRYNTTTGGVEYNSGSAWNTVGTALGYTPVNRAGDTMSGSLMLAAGQYLGLGSGSTAGTVAGQMWYDSGVIKYFDGTTVKSLGVAGAGITSLNGLTANVQSFVVGSAGNAPAITSASSAHTLDIPMASASGSVTAGLISNTDYAAFNAKMSSTLNSTQVWVGNGSNAAEARTLSGDISISNVGLVTADKTTIGTSSKLQQLDASGVANALGIGLINSGTVRILPATPTTASYDLRLPAGSPAANQILQSDATGQMSWVTNTASSGYVNGGNTFAGNATIGLNDAYTLGFKTNNATRMTLDASGNFGIGTATPTAALDVNGAINISGTNGISYPSTDSTAGSSIAIGASALVQQYSLASAAYRNTAIGYQAMSNAGLTTAATKNTAVGYKAGANSTTGFQNTYIGYQAGSASGSGATRTSTAIGANATVNAGGSGYDVVLVGANSSCCTGGTGGVVVGASAAGSGNTGIAIGNSASQAGDNSIAIGYSSATAQAGAVALGITAKTASYNGVSIGSGAGSTNVSGNNNVLIGAGVGSTTLTTGARNLLIGVDSSVDSVAASTSNSMNIGNAIYATNMKNATNTSGVAKIGINNNSPASIFDITDTSTTTSALIVPRAATFTGTTVNGMIRYNTTSSQFEFYQNGAWVNYSTGSGSSLVVAPSTGSLIGGTTAASSVTTAGLNNIAYGYQTLNSNTTGSGNTAMGYQAIALDNSGYNNIAIGYQAAYSGGGNENTTVGSMAYYNSDSGNQNVAIGGYALNRSQGASGNTAVGYDAGDMLTSGAGNVILGWEAGNNLTTGSNNIVIGYNIGAPSATGSNQMTIGNMIYGTGINGTGTTPSTGKIGIGTASPSYTLSVNGTANATTFLMNGSSSAPAAKVTNAAEPVAVSATAATGTVNFYLASGAVQYYTSNASANWTLNWAWSSGTSLNTALSTNDSVTTTFLVTQGATAYYPSAFTIDGTSVTPKWLGGSAPTAGNPSSIDVYTCTIIKTASAVFSVLCSQAQYK
ncbi:MAG: hypothetical protein JSU04_15985, partial [Bdellovibrionales bacterium]|nr:hypothetical protein [Bdellovibrionales bacterium]